MLETISALKSNNSRKIPNFDPSLLDHMRRLLRGLVKSKGVWWRGGGGEGRGRGEDEIVKKRVEDSEGVGGGERGGKRDG